MEKSPIFEKTYEDYLSKVAQLDFGTIKDNLGIDVSENKAIIPFFGKPYTVSPAGIFDAFGKKPFLSVCVILCKYLLMCPPHEPTENDWVSYKDFKDAAPLIDAFMNYAQKPIAKLFSGRLKNLEEACNALGGLPPSTHFSYDFSIQLNVLPKVAALLLFNDADSEFSAQCLILFQRSAERYLDMECVAMAGMLLYEYLKTELN